MSANDPEIQVIKIRSLQPADPELIERYNREREQLTQIQHDLIDAHDRKFFRDALGLEGDGA